MLVLNSNQRRCNFSRKSIPSHDQQPSRGKMSCVRRGRSLTAQIGKVLATLWNVANDFVDQRFANMEGASPTSVADRPHARINLVDRASGISVPHFGGILALTSLEKDCACVRLGSAPTRQPTRETRYLHFKWLCESWDANCLT